ncbi:transposase IS66 family protein [Escherichia coli 2-460-02_S4_C1]|nr:transposase IS66 family protein [Escherichia coli 2-460-02_S4_C1]
MNDISSDDIFLLKQRLAEQEALIHALQEKLSNREREIDHLQAQLDKLPRDKLRQSSQKSPPPYRTNGSRSEPASERERYADW